MGIEFDEMEVEKHLADNLRLLGDLRLIGRQVPILGGTIDILAETDGWPVIIEVKASAPTDAAIGQILRYGGCLQLLQAGLLIWDDEPRNSLGYGDLLQDRMDFSIKVIKAIRKPRLILAVPFPIKNSFLAGCLHANIDVLLYQVSLKNGFRWRWAMEIMEYDPRFLGFPLSEFASKGQKELARRLNTPLLTFLRNIPELSPSIQKQIESALDDEERKDGPGPRTTDF